MNIDRLIEICEQYQLPLNNNVVIREAYIPYIPPNWNGYLVLGEAQNLSSSYENYVDELKEMTQREKVTRLQDPNDLRIMPWDNGSLKIALKATLDIDPASTAVSNAVLWSQTYDKTSNKNPSKSLEKCSANLWNQMLNELKPSRIIASGAVARRVMENTSWNKNFIKIIHPDRIRYIKADQNEKELLLAYPIVEQTIKKHSHWIRGNKKKAIIRFSCYVSKELMRYD